MNSNQKLYNIITELKNPVELSDVLLRFFGKLESNSQFEQYSTKNNLRLLLEWNSKQTKLLNVFLSENFPDEQIELLIERIEKALIKNQNESMAHKVCFSSIKVIGSYKYHDIIEILPIPASAPQLGVTSGNHPFILKFKYMKSEDDSINMYRTHRKAIELIRILNVILKGRIFGENRYATQTWGRSTKSDINSGSVWFNVGYSLPASLRTKEIYEAPDGIEGIELVDDNQYYTYINFLLYAKYLTLPRKIESLLDMVFNLTHDDFNKFYIACTWIEIADITSHISYSSSLIALISALESIMEQPESCKKCGQVIASTIKDGTICSDCYQPILKLTSRFKQLLNVKDLDISFEKEKNILYAFRSKLVHGDRLFLADLNQYSFQHGSSAETSLHSKLGYVCRRIILDWLQKRK